MIYSLQTLLRQSNKIIIVDYELDTFAPIDYMLSAGLIVVHAWLQLN